MSLRRYVKALASRVGNQIGLQGITEQIAEGKILAAKALASQIRALGLLESLHQAEFKVFSQFGDDGIIQYLIHQTSIAPHERTFIEFGVENYEESNTRFLLLNDNWRGLVMDGDEGNVQSIRNRNLYWRHDLTAACAFIDAENINSLLVSHGFSGEIGILSIDIDGNDYWVWARIESVNPVIVIAEYNSVFGAEHAITVPYDPLFCRSKSHYSNLYWGASLGALAILARKKGYALVGSNSAGNNAYFVRSDRLGPLRSLSVREAYVESRFREARYPDGRLSFISGRKRLEVIKDQPVYSATEETLMTISALYHL